MKAWNPEKENSILNGRAISLPPDMLYKRPTSHFPFQDLWFNVYGDNIEGRIIKVIFTGPTLQEVEVVP